MSEQSTILKGGKNKYLNSSRKRIPSKERKKFQRQSLRSQSTGIIMHIHCGGFIVFANRQEQQGNQLKAIVQYVVH